MYGDIPEQGQDSDGDLQRSREQANVEHGELQRGPTESRADGRVAGGL